MRPLIGLCWVVAVLVAAAGGCLQTQEESGQPAMIEEAKPNETGSPPSQGSIKDAEGKDLKEVNVHSPGVPVSEDEYREMKKKASSQP